MGWPAGVLRVPALLGVLLLTGPTEARRPNVVVFMADDLGWGDLSGHGNANLQTPNLDRLAAEGASFRRFYVQPVCAPTRAEFLTGQHHPRVGVSGVSQGRERLEAGCPTIADHFGAAGYQTAVFGKWHNGTQPPYHPLCRGFDEFYGFTSGHWGHYFDFWLDRNNRMVKGAGYAADDFTDRAIEFASAHRDRPFFAFVAFNTPHSPMQVPDRWWDAHADQPLGRRGSEPAREDPQHTRAALAMCENLDWNVGRLLDSIDRLGLRDNTIVVFLTDNGPNGHRWNGGLRGIKGSTDEGGVRSPLFLRWPGRVPADRVVSEPAAVIDLLPTLTALAGVPIADLEDLEDLEDLDGVDLSSWVVGAPPKEPLDRALFSHWSGQTAARRGQYLLDANGRLFDLSNDPNQERDISAAAPEVASRMASDIREWRRSTGVDQEAAAEPFTVGHPSLATTHLPVRDAEGRGAVVRSNRYPNCTYFSNWRAASDRVVWDIEVIEPGSYEAVLYASAPAEAVGTTVTLECGGLLESELRRSTNTSLLGADRDRVPRGEGLVMDFQPIRLGVIDLTSGRQELGLGLSDGRGRRDVAVWQLSLTRVADADGPSLEKAP